MSGRASVGWQTALADLSLILFMITAAAVTQQTPGARAHERAGKQPAAANEALSARAEPLAVYIDAPGAPSLAQWLNAQPLDPRQQLTITARYDGAPGAQERAIATASRLVHEAGKAGRKARVVIEPGQGPSRVAIAYDAPQLRESGQSSSKVARSLLASK